MNSNNENSQDDRYLVTKVLSGDTNAFSSIIKNTEGLVAQIVYKMISNREDRKDIAQDVYLKAYQKLPGFRYQARISTWIAQIAYNSCLNYLEKKKLVFPVNLSNGRLTDEESLESLSGKNDPFFNEIEKIIYQKELSEIIRIQMDNLSPIYRTLITLYHNEELSYAEIAQITELPEGTVKNYLFRARKELRENILLTYKKEAL
jgi:RNA polymerase sigma factor (sigma-70 family)